MGENYTHHYENLRAIKDFIYKILIWCSGSDPKALELTSNSERIKHAGFGTLVLIPAAVGLFSMTYAVSTLTNIVFIYIIAGIVWSIIILFVDRFIVSTFHKTTNPVKFAVGFVCRLFLAGFVGIIIGHPIVLLIFDSSISEQLEKKREQEKAKFDNQIMMVRNHYNTLNVNLSKEADSLYGIKGKYNELLTAEQSGEKVNIPNIGHSSGKAGYKDRAKKIQEIIDDYQKRIEKSENLNKVQTQSNELIKNNRIDSIKSVTKRLDSVYSRDYLARVIALEELKKIEKQVGKIELLIILFFIFLDTIPIVFKALTPSGLYEQILAYEIIEIDGSPPPGIYKYKKLRQIENSDTETKVEVEDQSFNKSVNSNNVELEQSDLAVDLENTKSVNTNTAKDESTKTINVAQSSRNKILYKSVIRYIILITIQGFLIYKVTNSLIDVGKAALLLFVIDLIIKGILYLSTEYSKKKEQKNHEKIHL